MIPPPYDGIVARNLSQVLSHGINDRALSDYFNGCFQDVARKFQIWPCWVCLSCVATGRDPFHWGRKPKTCSVCGEMATYEVGTFQARAKRSGDAFEWAFYHLLNELFNVCLIPRPQAKIYDFETVEGKKIETKGSADNVICPDDSRYSLETPGLIRPDTKKKAFANAREFRLSNPNGIFYIVSNAIPTELVGYTNQDINGIFDITKVNQLRALARVLEEP